MSLTPRTCQRFNTGLLGRRCFSSGMSLCCRWRLLASCPASGSHGACALRQPTAGVVAFLVAVSTFHLLKGGSWLCPRSAEGPICRVVALHAVTTKGSRADAAHRTAEHAEPRPDRKGTSEGGPRKSFCSGHRPAVGLGSGRIHSHCSVARK